ncbi:MAG: diguanylate cyclase [Myxococcales bacterium]|nr:diguanylate cyclase [Myxococcales bacterium]
MFRLIRQNLAAKIALAVGLACLLVTIGGLVGMLSLFRGDILEHSRRTTELLARALQAVFEIQDPLGRSHPFGEVIEDLGNRSEFVASRVVDAEGRVVWSSLAGESGRDLPEPLLQRWRQGANYLEPEGDRQTLAVLHKVRARESCQKCHPTTATSGDLLGGLVLEVSHRNLSWRLSAYGALQWVTALLLVLFVAVITFLVIRLTLSGALERLSRAMRDVTEGRAVNLHRSGHGDELDRLAGELDRLGAEMNALRRAAEDGARERERTLREQELNQELAQKTRLFEEANANLNRRLEELRLLFDVNQALNSTLDIGEVLSLIAEMLGKTLGLQEFCLLLLDESGNTLEVRSAFCERVPLLKPGLRIPRRAGRTTESLERARTVIIQDVAAISRNEDDRRLLPERGSFLSVPLRVRDRVLGLLNFTRPEADAFPPDQVRLLTAVAQQAAMALLNASLFREKADQSVTDELTRLPNRREMNTRLQIEWNRSRRFGTPLALLMVDIDHFKRYNDVNGHLLGDRALTGVARVLKQNTRQVDTVARFGGEEFVVLLPGEDRESAAAVAEKLCRAVARNQFPRMETQPGGHLSISIGVASHPEDAASPDELLHRADLALYAAKEGGRGRVVRYDAELGALEERRKAEAARKPFRRRRRRHRPPGDSRPPPAQEPPR